MLKNKKVLRDKIFMGVKLSIEKLIDDRAKENGYLIVSKNGKVVKISAKELKRKANKR